jgi:hypothetical protein
VTIFTVPAPDRYRAALRLEARMLVAWTNATLERLRNGEITEDQARDHIRAYVWSYKIGRVMARVTSPR